jgi:PilZ domain
MKQLPRAEVRDRLRRKFIRFKFHADAEIVWRSAKASCRVTDISRGGMFIEVADPPREGTRFMLRLALNVPLRLACVVRRVVPNVGVGVTISVGPRERKRFDALLLALTDPLAPGGNFETADAMPGMACCDGMPADPVHSRICAAV